jgi:hypothetical protein
VRPPEAYGTAIPAGLPRARPRARKADPPSLSLSRRAQLAIVAATALVATLAIAVYTGRESSPGAGAPAGPGTAFLGTATCADWHDAGVARRLTIVRTLGVAATQPDPENRGATLGQGAAYGLFQRVCASRLSRSALLYETYNRAASFQFVGAGRGPVSAPLGHP